MASSPIVASPSRRFPEIRTYEIRSKIDFTTLMRTVYIPIMYQFMLAGTGADRSTPAPTPTATPES